MSVCLSVSVGRSVGLCLCPSLSLSLSGCPSVRLSGPPFTNMSQTVGPIVTDEGGWLTGPQGVNLCPVRPRTMEPGWKLCAPPPLCLSAEMQDLMAKRQSNCKARNTPLSQISTMFTVCTGETVRNNTLAYITRDPACSHNYSCIGYLEVIWLKFWFHATAIATINSETLGLHAKSGKTKIFTTVFSLGPLSADILELQEPKFDRFRPTFPLFLGILIKTG